MANVITLDMLIEKNACQEQANLFKKYYGKSVEITEDICLKYSNKFEFDWLVDNILSGDQREAYMTIQVPAYKAYNAIETAAGEAYQAIRVPAAEAYVAIRGPAYNAIQTDAWKAYKAIEWRAYKAYYTIIAPAYEAYEKEKARAFFIAYNS